ncbi:hypothetical protein [Oerskovia turbata]
MSDRDLILSALREAGPILAHETVAEILADRFSVIPREDLKAELSETRKVLFAAVHHRSGFTGGAQADVLSPAAPNLSPDWHEATAFAHLAMAEHLRKTPPVDERAVDDLHDALASRSMGLASISSETARRIARRLIADGWTKP